MAVRQKRSLSEWRSPNVVSRGDKQYSAILEKSIKAAAGDHLARRPAKEDLTHGFHPYAAKMPPALTRVLVRQIEGTILDPFCGSGTTLVEAKRAKREAVGFDINPLSVRLAKIKTTPHSKGFRKTLLDRANRIARAVTSQGREARGTGNRASKRNSDDPESPFSPHVYNELIALQAAINKEKPDIREALLMCLSAIVTKVSKKTSETDRRLVHKSIGRGLPSKLFMQRAIELRDGLHATETSPVVWALQADARKLPLLNNTIDGVITSPPYPGVYDYWRHHQERLALLGYSDRSMRKLEVGSRRDAKRKEDFAKVWKQELTEFVAEMARVTKPGGTIYMVIGDTVIDGAPWIASKESAELDDRLEWLAAAGQKRTLRGAREKQAFAGKPKREWVIALRKKG